jgi:hypothetical protein
MLPLVVVMKPSEAYFERYQLPLLKGEAPLYVARRPDVSWPGSPDDLLAEERALEEALAAAARDGHSEVAVLRPGCSWDVTQEPGPVEVLKSALDRDPGLGAACANSRLQGLDIYSHPRELEFRSAFDKDVFEARLRADREVVVKSARSGLTVLRGKGPAVIVGSCRVSYRQSPWPSFGCGAHP